MIDYTKQTLVLNLRAHGFILADTSKDTNRYVKIIRNQKTNALLYQIEYIFTDFHGCMLPYLDCYVLISSHSFCDMRLSRNYEDIERVEGLAKDYYLINHKFKKDYDRSQKKRTR